MLVSKPYKEFTNEISEISFLASDNKEFRKEHYFSAL